MSNLKRNKIYFFIKWYVTFIFVQIKMFKSKGSIICSKASVSRILETNTWSIEDTHLILNYWKFVFGKECITTIVYMLKRRECMSRQQWKSSWWESQMQILLFTWADRLWAPLSNKSWTATLGNLGQVNRRSISVVIYSYVKLFLSCTILLQNLHNIRLQLLKLATFILFAYTNTLLIEFLNTPHVKLVKMIILFENNSID